MMGHPTTTDDDDHHRQLHAPLLNDDEIEKDMNLLIEHLVHRRNNLDGSTSANMNSSHNDQNNNGQEERESFYTSHQLLISDDNDSIIREIMMQTVGPKHLLILILLMAISNACTVAIVPRITVDRYAHLYHNFTINHTCDDYVDELPCRMAQNDAQNAASYSSFFYNVLAFISLPIIGSLSDRSERKKYLSIGVAINLLPNVVFVLLQLDKKMNPNFYYIAGSLTGTISWFAVAVSCMSDALTTEYRTAGFGLLVVGFGIGFSVAPLLAVPFTSLEISIISVLIGATAIFFAFKYVPETLSKEIAARAQEQSEVNYPEGDSSGIDLIFRPLRELSIINRSFALRVLALANFLSSLANSGEMTLLVYYLENELGFNHKDIALIFIMSGVVGMISCGILLKPINNILGERKLIIFAYVVGAFHDFLYGFATTKKPALIAGAMYGLTNISYPVLSSLKSKAVGIQEQGQIQGAIFSVSSFASSIGPLAFRGIYYFTSSPEHVNESGSMFYFGGLLLLLAAYVTLYLPELTDEYQSQYETPDSEEVEVQEII